MGRPKKRPGLKASQTVHVYCTPSQKEEIIRLAQADNRSVSSFVLNLILSDSTARQAS